MRAKTGRGEGGGGERVYCGLLKKKGGGGGRPA